MVRVGISVEGLTEERFFKKVIVPHFESMGIYITPVDIGGDVSIQRVTKELRPLARSFDRVSTFYDFYGFKKKNLGETKDTLENKIKTSVDLALQNKIYPYVQMHEFESLLFSGPDSITKHLSGTDIKKWCDSILSNFGGCPEAINDSPQTAPSKRLEAHTNYKKTINGPVIAEEIGLSEMRKKCPGFDNWLRMIEAWRT